MNWQVSLSLFKACVKVLENPSTKASLIFDFLFYIFFLLAFEASLIG